MTVGVTHADIGMFNYIVWIRTDDLGGILDPNSRISNKDPIAGQRWPFAKGPVNIVARDSFELSPTQWFS
jgi:hypothetical protein